MNGYAVAAALPSKGLLGSSSYFKLLFLHLLHCSFTLLTLLCKDN
jgi:hypothetical protein